MSHDPREPNHPDPAPASAELPAGSAGQQGDDARIAASYAATPRDEPPAVLDAAILAAAHRAVGARPQAAGASEWRWRPLAWAAIVVLTASIGLAIFEEDPRLLEGAEEAAPQAAVPAQPELGERAAAESTASASRADEAAAPDRQRAREPVQDQDREQARAPAAPLGASVPGTPGPAAAEATSAKAAPIAPALSQDKALNRTMHDASRAMRSEERADDPMRDDAPSAEAGTAADSSASKPPSSFAAAPAVPPPALPQADSLSGLEASAQSSIQANADARQRLARISELIRLGRLDEARRDLTELRQSFPDFPVPPELLRQLGEPAPR